MAKVIAQIVLQGLRVVGRSFGRALKQEFEASQQAARARASSSQQASSGSASPFGAQVSLDEAMKILNVEKLDPEQIQKNYDHLFSINEKGKGGSFYLQSKVVRAKERIDSEMAERSQTQSKPPAEDSGA